MKTIQTYLMAFLCIVAHETNAQEAKQPQSGEKPMTQESFKRRPPVKLNSLRANGIIYSELRNGLDRGFQQPGGIIQAIDEKSGNELWLQQVYQTAYTNEERDVQDVYIKKMEFGPQNNSILITTERYQKYKLDLITKSVEILNKDLKQ
ncbi:hypothetical protein V8J88_11675 [Massilia sp. W12]|uniref:hypothetical protein n=1 Tax=Massilia sp. W12 TaxID=3126507 RepID=UPI0030CDAE85